jgi:putative endonuclease
MYFVYILKLKNSNYYIGFTPDLKKRLQKHNKGDCLSTKNQRPLKLVWFAGFKNKRLAQDFEKY